MMNPVSAKKMVMLLQEAYPARPKVDEYNNTEKDEIGNSLEISQSQGMHFLNFPPAMQTVYNLMQVLTLSF